MVSLLIFLIPYSLFSVKLHDFGFYLPYLLSFVGLFVFLKYLTKTNNISYKIKPLYFYIFLFFLYLCLSITLKIFLIKDLIKFVVIFFFFIGTRYYFLKDQKKFMKIMNWSIVVLVVYGLFQYIMLRAGNLETITYFHKVFNQLGHSDAFNIRAGVYRVASFTRESSYFCFIVGIYFFITKNNFMKLICLIGLFISFSLILVYVGLGLFIYKVFKTLRIPSFYTMILILAFHIVLALYFFQDIPVLFRPTFDHRYLGINEFLKFGFIESFFGSFSVNSSYYQALLSPFSNIGSLLYIMGLIGIFLYINIYYFLGKNSYLPTACFALFLFGFNYYYLTAWPIMITFYVILINYSPNYSSIEDSRV
jgi:hypothetical protein